MWVGYWIRCLMQENIASARLYLCGVQQEVLEVITSAYLSFGYPRWLIQWSEHDYVKQKGYTKVFTNNDLFIHFIFSCVLVSDIIVRHLVDSQCVRCGKQNTLI